MNQSLSLNETLNNINTSINLTLDIRNSSVQKTVVQGLIQTTFDFILYHSFTIFVVSLIALTIAINHYGAQANMEIAKKARGIINHFLKSHFSNYDGELVQESPNIIKMYASGKQNCVFAIFAFALIPRQQVLSFFFNFLYFKLKDQLVIQIPIKNPTSLPVTMAIVRKKNIRQQITKKKYPDIKNLCKQYKPANKQAYNVPQTHAILVQKKQHVQYFLASQKQVKTWQNYAKLVKLVYISDINKFSRYPMALRMVINLTEEDMDKSNGEGLLALLEWMMNFVDRISKVRMSSMDKKQAKKKREGIVIQYDQF